MPLDPLAPVRAHAALAFRILSRAFHFALGLLIVAIEWRRSGGPVVVAEWPLDDLRHVTG